MKRNAPLACLLVLGVVEGGIPTGTVLDDNPRVAERLSRYIGFNPVAIFEGQ